MTTSFTYKLLKTIKVVSNNPKKKKGCRQNKNLKMLGLQELLDEYEELCEYPTYIRGKIARIEGELNEALIWFDEL